MFIYQITCIGHGKPHKHFQNLQATGMDDLPTVSKEYNRLIFGKHLF